MKRIAVLGVTVRGELAATLARMGYSLEDAAEKTDQFAFSLNAAHELLEQGVLKDSRITYGPQRKGKGGKVKRW